MFLWFLGASWVSVWSVFRSPAIDYRLVMVGSVLPLVELLTGTGPMHSVFFPVLLMLFVMLATMRRRLVRRRWLGLVIGVFAHQVVDGCWADADRFWWPLTGGPVFSGSIPELGHGWWTALAEALGAALLLWAFGRFHLDEAEPRARFLATGQLDRSVAAGEEPTC